MDTIKLPEPTIIEPVVAPKTITDTKAVAEPKTTAEEDRKTQGQRNINALWEITQAALATFVTTAVIYCEVNAIESEALRGALIMVLAMYFQRTNHTKIGGIGGTDSR